MLLSRLGDVIIKIGGEWCVVAEQSRDWQVVVGVRLASKFVLWMKKRIVRVVYYIITKAIS